MDIKVGCLNGDRCDNHGKPLEQCALNKDGYHKEARTVTGVSGSYTLLCEKVSCSKCKAQAGRGINHHWPAWHSGIVSQLSEAHQALFPAVLTTR